MVFALEGFHCICLRVIILCRVHLEHFKTCAYTYRQLKFLQPSNHTLYRSIKIVQDYTTNEMKIITFTFLYKIRCFLYYHI